MRHVLALAALAAGLATGAMAGCDAARGAYLVEGPAGCGNCHSPLGPDGFVQGMELAGRLVEDSDAFMAHAPNITPAGRVAG